MAENILEHLESEPWNHSCTLVVIDRFDDLASLLTLSFTYMGLCGDLLGLNAVDLTIDSGENLDDFMWRKYATAHIDETKNCINAVEIPAIRRLQNFMVPDKQVVSKAVEADLRQRAVCYHPARELRTEKVKLHLSIFERLRDSLITGE